MSNNFKINFIGIGAPRCGTTWLARCLAEHPEIDFSKPKETHFFDYDYNYEKGGEFYHSYFNNNKDAKVRGEITPSYFLHEKTAKRIKGYNPNVKLFIVLRDPVERAASGFAYNQNRRGQRDTFEQVIDQGCENPYIQQGLYYRYLSQFMQYFDSSQLRIYLYDDIQECPDLVLKDLYDFIGVDLDFLPSKMLHKVNASKNVNYKFLWFARLFEKRKIIKQTKLGFFFVQVLKKIGVNAILKFLLKLNRTKLKPGKTGEDYLTSSNREKLYALYKNDLKQLKTTYDVDIKKWIRG